MTVLNVRRSWSVSMASFSISLREAGLHPAHDVFALAEKGERIRAVCHGPWRENPMIVI